MSVREVFQRITTALENAGVEYMLFGSFASAHYSSPRSTQDIDILISARPEQLKILVEDLEGKNDYAELDAALDGHRNNTLFNIIDLSEGWKIDLMFRKSTPFGHEEFRRRRKIGLHGLQVFVASPEDIIIAKLDWAKQWASHRQLEDAAAVVTVQGQALDMAYLEQSISKHGLRVEWDRACAIAGSGYGTIAGHTPHEKTHLTG